jgi:dTDP-4-dehydrorhamnose reductase
VRVAVTGAGGRLGRALVAALEDAPFAGLVGPIAWTRREFDLDAPETFGALLDRHRPEVVVHAAAWTDVDGCARDPDLALARNARATGRLAQECAARAADLVHVSTNEVFDGSRTDGAGYGPDDATRPINAYGSSKLAGEEAARAAYASAGRSGSAGGGSRAPQLAIVRTAWLFGPPGNDFPAKILAAAARAHATGEPLRVVADEWGTPTYAFDVADGIVQLLGAGEFAGTHHLVDAGVASRSAWAREVLRQAALDVSVVDVPASTWRRDSAPPPWGVLAPTPLPSGEPLRDWRLALADYLPELLRTPGRPQ